MAYASVDDLAAVPGLTVPATAALLLTRASRDIDAALISATYDPADPDITATRRDSASRGRKPSASDR